MLTSSTEFLKFLQNSPTAFHAANNSANILQKHGFQQLFEKDSWPANKPGKYYVLRNNSSLIAFTIGTTALEENGLRMAGAHTDSPCLKIKPLPVQTNSGWLQFGVEVYGGALLAPWFDRDLSLAGRIITVAQDGELNELLIDFQEPIAFIPSLAIHFDRDANKKKSINKQNDIVPVVGLIKNDEQQPTFPDLLAEQVQKQHPSFAPCKVTDWELFLYDVQPPTLVGLQKEFISGARLDNLLSCHAIVSGLVTEEPGQNCLIVLNDHEEVGSVSTSGAKGNFLRSVLQRLLPDPQQRSRCLARSLFISTDNAHSVHPNFAEKHDTAHLPICNKGPVVKNNANQRYASNAVSASFFKSLCERTSVPFQEFVMRNDLACGSTIGPSTAGEIGVRTVDVGVATLGMHSIRELAGSDDHDYLQQVLHAYFQLPESDTLWLSLGQ